MTQKSIACLECCTRFVPKTSRLQIYCSDRCRAIRWKKDYTAKKNANMSLLGKGNGYDGI